MRTSIKALKERGISVISFVILGVLILLFSGGLFFLYWIQQGIFHIGSFFGLLIGIVFLIISWQQIKLRKREKEGEKGSHEPKKD